MRIGTISSAAELEARATSLRVGAPTSAVVSFANVSEMAGSGIKGLGIDAKSVELANEQPQVGLSTTPRKGPRVM